MGTFGLSQRSIETMPTAFPLHTSGPPESSCNNMFDIDYNHIIEFRRIDLQIMNFHQNRGTWQAPLLVLEPPAHRTLSGSFCSFFHNVWQVVKLIGDTSVTSRSFTELCCSVLPHPATWHLDFGFSGLSSLWILMVFTPLLVFSFLDS